MAAYGLPTDAALSANANIDQRAKEYKKANVAPGARIDELRVLAFADILNDITLTGRIALAEAEAQAQAATRDGSGTVSDPVSGPADDSTPGNEAPADGGTTGSDPADGGPGNDDGRGDGDQPADGKQSPAGRPGPAMRTAVARSAPAQPRRACRARAGGLVHLTLPLATLLGLADRPGEGSASAPSTPPWPATSPPRPPATRTAPGTSPSPTPAGMRSGTAAPNPPARNGTSPGHTPRAAATVPGPSPAATTIWGRLTGTAPGHSPCRAGKNSPLNPAPSR